MAGSSSRCRWPTPRRCGAGSWAGTRRRRCSIRPRCARRWGGGRWRWWRSWGGGGQGWRGLRLHLGSSSQRQAENPTSADPADRNSLFVLRDALRRFAAERDWDQFHSPKNLAAALCVEAAELLEHFQWLSDDDSKSLSTERLRKVQEEMGDVFLYLIRLADKLNVSLIEAATNKIAVNARKYPAEKARGSSRKYTEL